MADVMVERPGGHRILLAPSDEIASFVAGTYDFDEVRTEPNRFSITGSRWSVAATSLHVEFDVGRRTAVGQLLSLVPRPVARSRWWCRSIEPIASRIRPGVHTLGSAGGGRREYYAALDEHEITHVHAVLDGSALGAVRAVRPPVRFGFGSAPPRPALVRVTTTVLLPDRTG
jgi:hypothetical protein